MKRNGLQAHLPCRRRPGLELPRCLPCRSTCSCRRRSQRPAGGRFPARGLPGIRPRRRRLQGAGAATCGCAGLQRRWLAAALKDARCGSPQVPRLQPPFECQTRGTPIRWKWRIRKLSQNVCFKRMMDVREESITEMGVARERWQQS